MLQVNNIKMPVGHTQDDLKRKAAALLKVKDLPGFQIVKRSIDARDKSNVFYVYSVQTAAKTRVKNKNIVAPKEMPSIFPACKKPVGTRPVVVGSGPAGLFCAWVLAKCGQNPVVLERGAKVDQRAAAVKRFWRQRELNEQTNVQFGEGGAGTFSDGKLNTNLNSPYSQAVLRQFVACGAPEEILYDAKPHIGTDRLRGVVKAMREEICALGGEVLFHSQLTDIGASGGRVASVTVNGEKSFAAGAVFLACGHSARDTFSMLYEKGVFMEQKPFAVGVRIEHLQEAISKTQYGAFYKSLPAAPYKMAAHTPRGALYTFCMCPGGVVVAAASEEGGVVTNGMSEHARDGKNANSALLVNVNAADFASEHPLAGVRFQRKLEQAAFCMGGKNYNAPAQLATDFMAGKESRGFGSVLPTYRPGVTPANLAACLNEHITDVMRAGLLDMDRKLSGFLCPDALLTGVESRSSSPVRLVRGPDMQSVSLAGLYPCGEGAGYAGGIMSAAIDGIRCAKSYLEKHF